LHSSYQRPPPFEPIPTRVRRTLADEQAMQERARVLAEQRARRSQYLPDEDVDSESEWDYNQVGPRQQAYLEARRRQGIMERRRREEELRRQRVLEEQKWQEDLERKQREDQELHRKLLEERKRELRLKREEGARQEGREKVPLIPHEDTSISVAHPKQQETPPSSPPKPSSTEQEVKMEVVEKDAQPTSVHTLEEMNEAAARIQRQYRMYRSSGALNDIATEFEKLKKEFVYPCVIDFQKPGGQGGHITVPARRPPSDFDGIRDEAPMEVDGCEGKLGYTSTNYALNAYSDALDKLLMKLDGVESCGDERIRMKRRGIVKDIEKEVARFEWYWKQAWADYIAEKGNQ